MKILVTGRAGHLGEALVRTLEAAGHSVTGADVLGSPQIRLLALERAPSLGFARYIISATTPFGPGDMAALRSDAAGVLRRRFPGCGAEYARRGWSLPRSLDRVYVNERARADLDWRPRYDFARALDHLQRGLDHQSPLSRLVGSKGYHRSAEGA